MMLKISSLNDNHTEWQISAGLRELNSSDGTAEAAHMQDGNARYDVINHY